MYSKACEEGKHDLCVRPSCSCYCDHPKRGTAEQRDEVPVEAARARADTSEFANIKLDRCVVAENVRRAPGDVTELVASIRKYGILQPLSGCAADNGRVDIYMGQRRLTAARQLNLATVPVQLRPRPDERTRVLEQLEENYRRRDMSPIDQAIAFDRLVREGMTNSAIGSAVGLSAARVEQYLYLLTLPDFVQEALHTDALSQGVMMEVPRALWKDSEAIERLAWIGATRNGVRRWLAEEVEQHGAVARGVLGGKWATSKVQLPAEVVRLAGKLAEKQATTVPQLIEELIRGAAAPARRRKPSKRRAS